MIEAILAELNPIIAELEYSKFTYFDDYYACAYGYDLNLEFNQDYVKVELNSGVRYIHNHTKMFYYSDNNFIDH